MASYRSIGITLLIGTFWSLWSSSCPSADAAVVLRADRPADVSFRNEIQHSVQRGLAFLLNSQNSNGWWTTPDHPALSALALSALMGAPDGRYRTNPPLAIRAGYAEILASVKPDGSIHRGTLINYNTALSMMALLATGDSKYEPILRKARAFLVKSQIDLDTVGKLDSPFDGGIGYGDKYAHSDMNNTLMALEALHATRHLVRDQSSPDARDLNWDAVIHFIQNCQNLPGTNKQDWVSDSPNDRGGFVYYPGHSMAGDEINAATGRVALRSYGSISYAGLLSYIYASLNPDDPRVAAVLDWLRSNYTLDENPGMGLQGLYYYLHLLTKGLTAAEVDALKLKNGRTVDWKHDVAMRLINLQQKDGSWSNTNGRWWETDPNLVTAYSVLALEILCRKF